MSTFNQRKAFSGVTKLRKTLRRLEPEITSEVRESIRRGANAILFDAKQNAESADYGKEPGVRDTGDMIDSMSIKYGNDGFTALIGPAAQDVKTLGKIDARMLKSGAESKVTIRSKDAKWNVFKGLWAEFGTKGSPKNNIPAITPAPFMQPAFDANKGWIAKDVNKAVSQALADAVRTTTDV